MKLPRGFLDKYWKTPKQKKSEQKQDHAFKKLYGITFEGYQSILESQGGVCAICGNKNKNGQALSVDHDHKTGTVRGILCQRCNYALGYIDDSIEIAKKIIEYLDPTKNRK